MTRNLACLIVAGWMTAACCGPAAASTPASEEAARELLGRLLPDRVDSFVFQAIPKEDGHDVFEIESAGGKIVIRGSTGVAMASGLNWYLKYYGNCHVSWCGDQLNLPDRLPPVEKKIRRVSPFKYRYCFNFCAFSYTLAWWDWPQWERMIDWMAMHGINMPLSVTGQEAIWQKVYRDIGLSDKQIGQFMVGPGYLPFGWMGCMDGWGGPLPQTWIDAHLKLQKKIVARQRALGMTPVLQGFTGHVPVALKQKLPQARFRQLPSWCGFPGTLFIDPTDPAFEKIGKAFIEEQTRQFGTDHLYASDTFIEMQPPTDDPEFLAGMGRAVYGAMKSGDPEAVWVMQGWIFFHKPKFWKPPQAKALLGAVPDDRMILLDLFCERKPVWNETQAFYGKPWLWSVIHSFGGRVGLYGGLPQITDNLAEAMASPNRGKLAGLGLIMEGFGYNPVVYDFLTEMTWRTEVPKLDDWLGQFVRRRYGRAPQAAQEAWALLRKTAYSSPAHVASVICRRPRLPAAASGVPFGTPYDATQLAVAWQKLLESADVLGNVDTYQFDLVHVGHQVMSNRAPVYLGRVFDAYYAKDREALAKATGEYAQFVSDLDELLATRREFLLGKWLADAKHWATNDDQRRLYEWNARNLITLWGPRDSVLHDYSQRQWSGMFAGFYLPRWQMLFERLDRALAEDKPFDAKAFENQVRDWEVNWTHNDTQYPAVARGDPLAVARRLWTKYGKPATERDVTSLTTGKPASCSAALAPYPARLANDGWYRNTNRYWATDVAKDKDAWWQVDLEEPTTVGRVVVVFYYGDERYYGFTVETSNDGKQWDMAADHGDDKVLATPSGFTCRFTPRKVRYIRVAVPHNSANTGRHLVEVMAFEK